jgi:hypothetical protein
MSDWEWVKVAASVIGLVVAAGAVVVGFVSGWRDPDDKTNQFACGHLASSGLLVGLASALWLVAAAEPYVASSRLALVTVIGVNLAVQPFALLFCWTGIRKLSLGVRGRVGHAWREVTEQELADCPPKMRRTLALYCVMQGLIALPIGFALGAACAWPLLGALA